MAGIVIEEWRCGNCGVWTSVRHFLQRGGIIVHDPEAAYREVAGLDQPEPTNRSNNGQRP